MYIYVFRSFIKFWKNYFVPTYIYKYEFTTSIRGVYVDLEKLSVVFPGKNAHCARFTSFLRIRPKRMYIRGSVDFVTTIFRNCKFVSRIRQRLVTTRYSLNQIQRVAHVVVRLFKDKFIKATKLTLYHVSGQTVT